MCSAVADEILLKRSGRERPGLAWIWIRHIGMPLTCGCVVMVRTGRRQPSGGQGDGGINLWPCYMSRFLFVIRNTLPPSPSPSQLRAVSTSNVNQCHHTATLRLTNFSGIFRPYLVLPSSLVTRNRHQTSHPLNSHSHLYQTIRPISYSNSLQETQEWTTIQQKLEWGMDR